MSVRRKATKATPPTIEGPIRTETSYWCTPAPSPLNQLGGGRTVRPSPASWSFEARRGVPGMPSLRRPVGRTPRDQRTWQAVLVVIATVTLSAGQALAAAPVADPDTVRDRELVKVIVTYDAASANAAEAAIKERGGKVRDRLELANAISARVPRGQLKQLAADKGVRRVELDPTVVAFDHGADTGDHEYENAW